MTAIILSIGDELVLGQTVDTNSAWLSQHLATIGVPVIAHITVADDQKAIEQAICDSAGRCELLLVSGGIGPTEDDLTRQALAAVTDAELVLDESWLARLVDFFKSRGREMPQMNRIQAMIPRGAKLIENTAGTAAGIEAVVGGSTRVFVMPGVPKEMKIMFTRDILPKIAQAAEGAVILSRTLHTFGLGESSIAEKLGHLMKRERNPSVGTTVSNGIVSLRLNARFSSREEAQMQLESTEAACRAALGDLIFGHDDQTLQQVVAGLLIASQKTIVTAESCTGGLLAKMLTDISGSSAYFTQGWITYANEAKQQRLGVSENLINLYGAVSEPVACAMACNARRLAKSDYALAITGIAGPTGGIPAKPIGTVCIALAFNSELGTGNSELSVRTFLFSGDRDMIRDRAAKMALSMLRFHLLGRPVPF